MSAVYKAIAAVQGELAKTGIGKDGKNEQQRYRFRGIDAVYNALAPLLAKYELCILPRVIGREVVERTTKSGSPLFYVTVDVEFDFVAAEDGSTHTIRTAGEAMDSADKATNKAMSAAYKYAAFMAFAIPTEGDNDADATTHEVQARAPDQPPQQKRIPLTGLYKTKAAVKDALGDLVRDMHGCADRDMLDIVLSDNAPLINQMQSEEPLAYWYNGDGGDFKGLAKEIEEAKQRVSEPIYEDSPGGIKGYDPKREDA